MRALYRIGHVRAAAILLLLAACEEMKELPGAPSELTGGVTIYEHANFEGTSALLTRDVPDLGDYSGPCRHEVTGPYGSTSTYYSWDDCISSLRVAPGWRATIYEHDNFKGEWLEVTSDVPNLQLVRGSCAHDGLNDCITSIRVRQP